MIPTPIKCIMMSVLTNSYEGHDFPLIYVTGFPLLPFPFFFLKEHSVQERCGTIKPYQYLPGISSPDIPGIYYDNTLYYSLIDIDE